MADSHEPSGSVPFSVSIRGEVDAEYIQELYERVFKLAQTVGEVTANHSINVIFSPDSDRVKPERDPSDPLVRLASSAVAIEITDEELLDKLLFLGQHLHAHRRSARKSQAALASETQTSQSYISQLERGRATRPDPYVLSKIAEALNLRPVDVLARAAYRLIKDDREMIS